MGICAAGERGLRYADRRMRVVGLLMLVLGGCHLMFGLDDPPPIELAGTATVAAPGPTTAITVPRPLALATNDVVVAILRITPASPNTLLAPAGWVQLSEQSRAWTPRSVARAPRSPSNANRRQLR